MKWIAAAAACLALGVSSSAIAGSKSALDGYQFDGIPSDADLKAKSQSRREWLKANDREAKEYWFAWDCKDKPCDNRWSANIRKKAALVPRLPSDPKPPSSSATIRK